ncbi:MAG TPA: glycosyltransferase family 39 protein [Rhodocyclaceae bacterium]
MRPWLAAAALPLLLLLAGLGSFGLLNNVEGMYAEIGREMLVGGNWHGWVIPHLNGLPYIEKPPLLYWATALSMALFGPHDWAVRLAPVAAGLLTLAGVAWWAARLGGRTLGASSLFVLGTTGGFLLIARVALTDALLTAFLTLACLLAYLALAEQRRLWWRLALACAALAMLAKGFVALALFGLIGVCHLLINERAHWRQHLRLIADPLGWGLFLLLAVPWHLAAARELPQFTWFYFVNEHWLRFLGQREPKDYYSGNVFYYLPRLALMALPWWPLALVARWKRPATDDGQRAAARFLWVCVLAPLIFFSISKAKANYYAVVCLPPLALLAALSLERWRQAGTLLLRTRLLALPGLLLIPALVLLLDQAQRSEAEFSARPLANEIARRGGLPLFLYQDYENASALPFYLQRADIGIIDSQSDDLRFGLSLKRDPQRYPSLAAFAARREPALVLVYDSRARNGLPPPLQAGLQKELRVGNATLYRFQPPPLH